MRLFAAATAALVLATACASPQPESPVGGGTERAVASVEIETFTFVPPDITVAVGTTITWTNRDDFAHTVTSGRARMERDDFTEGVLGDIGEMNARGTSFSWIVDEPGTFLYFCRYHPNMQGSVTVTDG